MSVPTNLVTGNVGTTTQTYTGSWPFSFDDVTLPLVTLGADAAFIIVTVENNTDQAVTALQLLTYHTAPSHSPGISKTISPTEMTLTNDAVITSIAAGVTAFVHFDLPFGPGDATAELHFIFAAAPHSGSVGVGYHAGGVRSYSILGPGKNNVGHFDGQGTAGTPSGGVITVQGVSGGTAQPVSLATLPALAAGTANVGHVDGQGTAGTPSGGVVSIQGVSGGTAQPVSGTFWQATQPVSLATLPALVAGTANVGHVDGQGTAGVPSGGVVSVQGVSGGTAQPVSGTFWQATQPVSLAALPALVAGTANVGHVDGQGTAGTPSGGVVSVQGVASGTALPVSLSALPALATGTNNIGSVALRDGSSNALTSTATGSGRAIDVNIAASAGENATTSATVSTAGNAVSASVGQMGNGTIVLFGGTYTALTLVFEASIDNSNWFGIDVARADGSQVVLTESFTATGVRSWNYACPGYTNVRVRVSAITQTAVPTIAITQGPFLVDYSPAVQQLALQATIGTGTNTIAAPAYLALSASASAQQLVAAPGAGLSIYVTDMECSNSAASAMRMDWLDASTVRYSRYMAAGGGGAATNLKTPWKLAANAALNVQLSAATAGSYASVNYYVAA